MLDRLLVALMLVVPVPVAVLFLRLLVRPGGRAMVLPVRGAVGVVLGRPRDLRGALPTVALGSLAHPESTP